MSHWLEVKGHPFVNQLTNTWKKGSHRCTFTIHTLKYLAAILCNKPQYTPYYIHTSTYITVATSQSLYIYNSVCVCLFVCGKCQNYGTDWRQSLRKYKKWPRECPPRVEIARLSALGETLQDFRFFLCGRLPFLSLISLPLPTLA